jgi:CheY-like chemotaxis protein
VNQLQTFELQYNLLPFLKSILLLDYRLGDMFGDSVARTIKQYNGIKIILISAYDLDRELVKELKENKYIAKYAKKPIHLANLIDLVADTIN